MTPSQKPDPAQEPEDSAQAPEEFSPTDPEELGPEESDLEEFDLDSQASGRRWLVAGSVLGAGLVLGGAVALGGWLWTRHNLVPWLESELTEVISRPVELGPVEGIGLSGVRLGPSTLPPTPSDPDTLSLEGVEVSFRLLDLWRRELPLSLTLDQGNLYLEQNAEGEWFDLEINLPDRDPDRDPFVDVRIATINVNDGQLTMVPYVADDVEPVQVAIADIQGQLEFTNALVEVPDDPNSPLETQQLNLALSGNSLQGGSLNLKGAVLLPPPQDAPSASADATEVPGPGLRANINLRTQAARATDIMPLVDSFLDNPLPVQFPSGFVSGQVDIESGRGVPTTIVGTARVTEGSVITRGLPEPLQNLQGDVRFRGREIEFEGVTASLGTLTAEAGGILSFDEGYDLSGQVNPFTVAQISELFDVAMPVSTVGTFLANVTMTGPLNRPVIASDIISQSTIVIDQVPFSDLRASTTLRAPNLAIDSFQASPQDGGAIAGSGLFTFGEPGQLSLTMTGDRLPATAIGRRYGLPDNVDLGPMFVDAEVAGPVGQLVGSARWRAPLGTYPAQGTVRLADNALGFTDTFVQVAGGTVVANGSLGLADRRWQSTLRAVDLQLDQLGAGIGGSITGEAELVGTLGEAGLRSIQGQGTAQATAAGGTVLTQATLTGGQWNATVQGRDLQMAAFAPDLQGTAEGSFRFTGSTDNLSLAGATGQGQLFLSDGLATAAARAPQLAQVRQPLTANLAWNGQSILVQQASTAGLNASGVITPQLSGPGAPTIANLDLNLNAESYSLAALPVPAIIPLGGNAFFQGRLRGRPGALALNGNASLVGLTAGDLGFASPLSGPVAFTQGGPLSVDLTGGGDRILVATAQGDRNLTFDVRSGEALAQGYTQGDELYATVANFPLSNLRLPQAGTNGLGTIGGLITSAEVVANLRQPTLRATFDVQDPSVGYLSLPTETTVAAFDPDAPERPLEVTRYGRLRGTITYANGVIGLVGGTLESASGFSRYLASGTYTLGDTPQINGELVVDNGQIQDLLQTFLIFEQADFRFNLLRPPEWFRPATEVDLASLAEVNPVGDRNASLLDQLRRLAEIQELQDILAAQAETAPLPPLEDFVGSISGTVTARGAIPDDLNVTFDLAGANWVWGSSNGSNGATYRIDEFIAQGSYQDNVVRLEPVSLRSDFSGFSATTQQGVALATLNGDFSLDPNDVEGRTLRLEVSDVPINAVRQPLRLPDNLDGLMNLGATLTGNLANPQVRGQLAVNEATINGNALDLATANFRYQDARLNLISRIAVDDQTDQQATDPLRLIASVPLPMPGLNQQPEADTVNVTLRMRDEGFALINLLTQAIAWESGEAALDLAVQGRWPLNQSIQEALTTLNVTGSANLDGVTISSRSLPEPITNLRGNIQVVEGPSTARVGSVYSRGLILDVQNLEGDFSNGKVVANGNLKLLPSVQDLAPGLFDNGSIAFSGATASTADNPFRLTLDNIALDLRNPAGTYRGRVDGNVVVGGSVFLLPPLVYGEVALSDGLLTLPEANEGGNAPASFATTREPRIFDPIPPVLEDFQLVLADNVRLAIPGLVDVRAEGTLDLVGAAPNIRPNGRINLPSGRINLLTTEFRLTGDENYAEFSDLDDTIDPYLVATLSAAVPDSAAAGNTLAAASPFPRNEISVSRIDQLGLTQAGVQTVRIRASVDGRASRVVNLQGVELSSTPPRSDGEIVALISGGFLTALESTLGSVSGGGDGFQGLLAFAGSALLNNLQNILGSGLERTDLRLFSASPPGQQGGVVDIGGEIGFNFSPNISASVQKVFTNVTPAVFSVRYRITDQITIRGTTSYEQFNENTGAVLEFRF
ncbi:translocation/assembly module TamB domain-containing protein [Nodosilinea sp. E11]|uniref:translocation/assembly module TamB domain-containing protein n=1 Tax=Nodosilinea sp. E11 TaxID=3037479 RepID=UPI0029341F2C|nr:translocation/assembly module TamB domain-containing protein [Nodosilinea sp. E11]WOD38426.1 translocation/assembly module TamB domain-containing protein [Nodosilinea sp. E11]